MWNCTRAKFRSIYKSLPLRTSYGEIGSGGFSCILLKFIVICRYLKLSTCKMDGFCLTVTSTPPLVSRRVGKVAFAPPPPPPPPPPPTATTKNNKHNKHNQQQQTTTNNNTKQHTTPNNSKQTQTTANSNNKNKNCVKCFSGSHLWSISHVISEGTWLGKYPFAPFSLNIRIGSCCCIQQKSLETKHRWLRIWEVSKCVCLQN